MHFICEAAALRHLYEYVENNLWQANYRRKAGVAFGRTGGRVIKKPLGFGGGANAETLYRRKFYGAWLTYKRIYSRVCRCNTRSNRL